MKIKVITLMSLLLLSSYLSADEKLGPALGSLAPTFQTKDIDGNSFDLKKELAKNPVVLVFYRGGWCPYCNMQLRKIEKNIIPKIKNNATLVAISVDKTSKALTAKAKEKFSFKVISDSKTKILKQYNLVNKLPDSLVKKYKNEYKIDVEKDSGEKHHIIAVPGVFVLSKSGKVAYRFVDKNYKKRAPENDIIDAVLKLN